MSTFSFAVYIFVNEKIWLQINFECMKYEYVIVVKEFLICDMNEYEENVNAFFLSRNTKK